MKAGTAVRCTGAINNEILPGMFGVVVEANLVRWLNGTLSMGFTDRFEAIKPEANPYTFEQAETYVFSPKGRRGNTRAHEDRGGGKRKATRG